MDLAQEGSSCLGTVHSKDSTTVFTTNYILLKKSKTNWFPIFFLEKQWIFKNCCGIGHEGRQGNQVSVSTEEPSWT